MYGKRIVAALDRRNLGAADVIKTTGMFPSTVYKRLKQSDLPTDFIDDLCAAMNIPREEIYLSPQELNALRDINPDFADIITELKYASDHYSKTEQRIIFITVLEALRGLRKARNGE